MKKNQQHPNDSSTIQHLLHPSIYSKKTSLFYRFYICDRITNNTNIPYSFTSRKKIV